MNSIQIAYINALLADAVYVENIGRGEINASRFESRLTATQANYLAANFTVLSSIESSKSLGSGFDAIVWQGKAGTPYAGQVYVSMRGTQGAEDIADDIGLAASGVPITQIVDMVNWWLRIKTPVGEQAQQIQFQTQSGYTLAASVAGTGEISTATSITSVNGHSLGGYLATAFTRLFGNQAGVQSVSTFNSAGFSNAAAVNIQNSYDQIANVLGLSGSFATAGAKQTNYFGANGIKFTTNSLGDMRLPGFNQYGSRTALEQEAVLSGGADRVIANHYMYKLTDYLALGAALEKLDPSLNFDKLNTLIKAGSNDTAASYEGVFDAVRKALAGPNVEALPVGDVSGNASSRGTYHATLAAFQYNPLVQGLAGQLLIRPANADLRAAARNSFGALVALQDLSPLWIVGTGGAADAQLAAIWQSNRTADYAAWEADKSSSHPIAFTDQWIADRAAMLGYVVQANQQDIEGPLNIPGATGMHYEDLVSGKKIDIGLPDNVVEKRQTIFGDAIANALTGKKLEDHLYGGAGDDTLSGLGGSDYLEGNAGDDTLDGGTGSDTLVGGAGSDTYRFSGDWGVDFIEDSDGQGRIEVNGQTLTGGKAVSANTWQSEDKQWRYALTEQGDLVITHVSQAGRLVVRRWGAMQGQQGSPLGLSLEPSAGAQPPAPKPEPGQYALQGGYFVPGGPKLPGGTWQIQSDGSIPGMVPLNDSNDLMVGGENEPNGLYRHTTGMEVDSEGKQHFTDGLTNSVSFWGLGGNDFMSGEQFDDGVPAIKIRAMYADASWRNWAHQARSKPWEVRA